jgi:hypothetical protein
MTSSHLCENLRLVLALVLTCNELKSTKHWSLNPSTHVSFLLKTKQFKKRNVHYQNFPSLGYYGLKISKEESAQVFMLSKASRPWALPSSDLFLAPPQVSSYSSKANCLRLYLTWPFTKLQGKKTSHIWKNTFDFHKRQKERTAEGREYSVNQ